MRRHTGTIFRENTPHAIDMGRVFILCGYAFTSTMRTAPS